MNDTLHRHADDDHRPTMTTITSPMGASSLPTAPPPTPSPPPPRSIRHSLSRLLSPDIAGGTERSSRETSTATVAIASGAYACGGPLDKALSSEAGTSSSSVVEAGAEGAVPVQLPLPRIKLKWSNQTSLSLPLTPSGAESLKRALLSAGQEREAGEDGAPETRLPWAVRPGEDFRVVNCAVWKKVVTGIVEKVQQALGCEEWSVEASLSELLLCEEGCFYSEGRESDDSPDAFATLIIQLPSEVDGGYFTVFDPSFYCDTPQPPSLACPSSPARGAASCNDRRMVMESTGTGMSYIAFYNNCERELAQVTNGCSLSLVYSLSRPSSLTAASDGDMGGVGSGEGNSGAKAADTVVVLSRNKREKSDVHCCHWMLDDQRSLFHLESSSTCSSAATTQQQRQQQRLSSSSSSVSSLSVRDARDQDRNRNDNRRGKNGSRGGSSGHDYGERDYGDKRNSGCGSVLSRGTTIGNATQDGGQGSMATTPPRVGAGIVVRSKKHCNGHDDHHDDVGEKGQTPGSEETLLSTSLPKMSSSYSGLAPKAAATTTKAAHQQPEHVQHAQKHKQKQKQHMQQQRRGVRVRQDDKRKKARARVVAVAETDALRRKRAVFVDAEKVCPVPPQPAESDHIGAIVQTVRDWSVAPEAFPSKLVILLSHHYPSGSGGNGLAPPMGMCELQGRDRAVCNLLYLAREATAACMAAASAPSSGGGGGSCGVKEEGELENKNGCEARGAGEDGVLGVKGDIRGAEGAMLDVFLTRVVMASSQEGGKEAYTTGPLIPLFHGDELLQMELAAKELENLAWRRLGSSSDLPDDVLPIDVASQILHSGGGEALADLSAGIDRVFDNGPAAVEFLGERVADGDDLSMLLRLPPAYWDDHEKIDDVVTARAQSFTSATGNRHANANSTRSATRFFVRAAIVFWPRVNRLAVQLEAQEAAVHSALKRLTRYLSFLDAAPPTAAWPSLWAKSDDAAAIKAAIVTIGRQPQLWLHDETEADTFFECLRRCEDPIVACHALDAICSSSSSIAYPVPDPTPQRSHPTHPSTIGPLPPRQPERATDVRAEVAEAEAPWPPPMLVGSAMMMPATALYGRAFALLDDLNCWRLAAPQLVRLLALNPAAFAGTVIARVAITSPMPVTAIEQQEQYRDGGGSEEKQTKSGVGAGLSSSSHPLSTAADTADTAGHDHARGSAAGRVKGRRGAGGGLGKNEGRGTTACSTWQEVMSVVLAGAMPGVTSGRLPGVEVWWGGCGGGGSGCGCGCGGGGGGGGHGEVVGGVEEAGVVATAKSSESRCGGDHTGVDCDALEACCSSPLPLLVMALQDTIGTQADAARMVRKCLGDNLVALAEKQRRVPTNATAAAMDVDAEMEVDMDMDMEERDHALDELGSYLWSLGDLWRSLARRNRTRRKRNAASGVESQPLSESKLGSARITGRRRVGEEAGTGGHSADDVTTMQDVVKRLRTEVVKILEAASSESLPTLPKCPCVSFARDVRLLVCEHAAGWGLGAVGVCVEDEDNCRRRRRDCFTCEEIIKPFLASPYECCTSWVHWDGGGGGGDDWGDEVLSRDLCERLRVRFSVLQEGHEKVTVLTKLGGSPEAHREMGPLRDAFYLRERARQILESANAQPWQGPHLCLHPDDGFKRINGVTAATTVTAPVGTTCCDYDNGGAVVNGRKTGGLTNYKTTTADSPDAAINNNNSNTRKTNSTVHEADGVEPGRISSSYSGSGAQKGKKRARNEAGEPGNDGRGDDGHSDVDGDGDLATAAVAADVREPMTMAITMSTVGEERGKGKVKRRDEQDNAPAAVESTIGSVCSLTTTTASVGNYNPGLRYRSNGDVGGHGHGSVDPVADTGEGVVVTSGEERRKQGEIQGEGKKLDEGKDRGKEDGTRGMLGYINGGVVAPAATTTATAAATHSSEAAPGATPMVVEATQVRARSSSEAFVGACSSNSGNGYDNGNGWRVDGGARGGCGGEGMSTVVVRSEERADGGSSKCGVVASPSRLSSSSNGGGGGGGENIATGLRETEENPTAKRQKKDILDADLQLPPSLSLSEPPPPPPPPPPRKLTSMNMQQQKQSHTDEDTQGGGGCGRHHPEKGSIAANMSLFAVSANGKVTRDNTTPTASTNKNDINNNTRTVAQDKLCAERRQSGVVAAAAAEVDQNKQKSMPASAVGGQAQSHHHDNTANSKGSESVVGLVTPAVQCVIEEDRRTLLPAGSGGAGVSVAEKMFVEPSESSSIDNCRT